MTTMTMLSYPPATVVASEKTSVGIATGRAKDFCKELVREVYARQGYSYSQSNRWSNWTTVFCVQKGMQISITTSIIMDSREGLPLDSVYPDKTETLRRAGKRIAEVGKLAANDLLEAATKSGLRADAHNLFAEILKYAVGRDIDCLCITVNPKHASFYRFLGFKAEKEQSERIHPEVNAPALFLACDIREWFADRSARPRCPFWRVKKLFSKVN